jgi:hypothetical protein
MPRETNIVKEAKEMQRIAGKQLASANRILKEEQKKKEERKVQKNKKTK